jgi:hypothetical protein
MAVRQERKLRRKITHTHTHLIPTFLHESCEKIFRYKKKTWLPTFGNVHEFVPLWRCLVGYPPKDVASLWPFCTKRRSILIIIFVFGRLVGRFNSSNFQCRWIEQMRRKKKEKKNRCCRHNEAVWDCRRERAWSTTFSLLLKQGHHHNIHWHTHK